MQLYLKNPASSDLRLALDEEHLQVPVADNELETTLYFNIEMPNEAGGQVAAQSLSCCTLGMRAIGRCTGGCCSGSASALSGVCNSICGIPESIARSMHYCCLNFRLAIFHRMILGSALNCCVAESLGSHAGLVVILHITRTLQIAVATVCSVLAFGAVIVNPYSY